MSYLAPRSQATAPPAGCCPRLLRALAASVPHGGYRFAYCGPLIAQQEPDGDIFVCYWPDGHPAEVTPRMVPLNSPALRKVQRWFPELANE